ncbi:MltR family transcriptional regulator [Bacillus tropicus]|uniref:MltR family transcriptional regulator n=1 Tax=Bacillus tropicus TaxID=2026188 RepID=UPI0030EE7126
MTIQQVDLHNTMNRLFENTIDDRSAAIVAASYLEDLLKEFLIKKFNDNFSQLSKTEQGNLTSGNGPLSTFSSRITIAFLSGLISKKVYDDLNNIRNIRNQFAHNMEAVDFTSDQKIKDKCEKLKLIKNLTTSDDLRQRFKASVVTISFELIGAKPLGPEHLENF